MVRDTEHRYVAIPNSCKDKCINCGKTLSVEHSWSGCKCSRCGKKRDENHKFSRVPGKCEKMCDICGKKQKTDHEYEKATGKCLLLCTICGDNKKSHNYNNNKCTDCGDQKLLCAKCDITKTIIDEKNKKMEARAAKMTGQVMWQQKGLLLCKNCNGITCSDCSKDTPGYYYKVCPLCEKEHKPNSIIKKAIKQQ